MIVLDTHIWIWWVHDESKLTPTQRQSILDNEENGLGICAISLWEVAKLVEYGRLELSCDIDKWFEQALRYPGITILDLTPEIAIESTHLPGEFHRDPADQMIVATARVYQYPLVTSDEKIQNYEHVTSIR